MTKRRRIVSALAAVVVVSAVLIIADRAIQSASPLSTIQASPALHLLPPNSLVQQRITQHRSTSFDGTAPAAVRINAQSALSAREIRDYYRQQLTRLGFTFRPEPDAPSDETLDSYVNGPLRADLTIEQNPGMLLKPGEQTVFQYALTD